MEPLSETGLIKRVCLGKDDGLDPEPCIECDAVEIQWALL